MASITYWSQLQPSPRDTSIADGLAARVRDPAWLLARQWQLARVPGRSTAARPPITRIGSRTTPFESDALGGTVVPLAPGQLLEPILEAETPQPDLATRVELGQTFESLVPAAIATPLPRRLPDRRRRADADPGETRFRSICAGRVTDGVALYQAAKAAKAGHQRSPPRRR